MRPLMKVRSCLFAAAILSAAAPVSANDSQAALDIGGLTLQQSANISLDYEDLFISADEVRITYRFTNHGKRDVNTLVAFPLPPQSDPEYNRDFDDLAFRTTVDGKPVTLTAVDVATVNGRNVETLLKKYGWDRDLVNDPESHRFFDELPKATADAAVRDGLLKRIEDGVTPVWAVQRNITRQQRFPAGKTVTVTHRYKPMIGGSVGGGLNREVRLGRDGTAASYAKEYCTDAAFLSAFDRTLAEKQRSSPDAMGYSETWINYVLKSGANWKGPIKDFRLVVDKGAPDKLVSFCMDGVRKISPTQFEVRKKNFEPTRDLSILVINWLKADGSDGD